MKVTGEYCGFAVMLDGENLQKTVKNLKEETEMEKVRITAHSGCDGTEDNSMESVLKGIRLGADAVEVDVRRHGRGLFLSHDPLTEGKEYVPLYRVFDRIRHSELAVNCDLKEPGCLYPVLELAEEKGLEKEQLILSGSVSCDLLAQDPEIGRRATVYLNLEEILKYLFVRQSTDFRNLMSNPWNELEKIAPVLQSHETGRIVRIARDCGTDVINLPWKLLDPEKVRDWQEAGAKLSVWTINEESILRKYLDADVYGITTRNAELALRIRREKKSK